MTTALLSSTYFGPVQWYQKLCRYDRVLIEHCDAYQKQTYRNRCLIATTQGVQALTVPVVHSRDAQQDREVIKISDHGNWRHLHWQALQTAYGDSPFFEYYEDDLRPISVRSSSRNTTFLSISTRPSAKRCANSSTYIPTWNTPKRSFHPNPQHL